jgi:hypothetical protein
MPLSRSALFEEAENAGSNPSDNSTIGDIVAGRMTRRDLVKGALAVTVLAAAGGTEGAARAATSATATVAGTAGPAGEFGFEELAVTADATHHVAPGYDAYMLIRWGDAVLADAPAFDPKAQTPDSQSRQFGYNNDFLGYLPIGGSSGHGLLVVNHEYTNEELMFPGAGWFGMPRFFDREAETHAAIEMMAHGGSVIEIRKTEGRWSVVADSKYARRITAGTEMRVSGPAAGHERMRTSADPTGTRVLGMLNNCAGGITPWGTWLTCEENINFYFSGKRPAAGANARGLERYGIPTTRHAWGKYHSRFDIGREPNEANRFGWVVEIDPFDPSSIPVKRTAMGRFKHEGAGNVINKDGRFVVYQGDDERFDYVYRFVTEAKVDLANPAANKDILDRGTLYAARFDADGRGQWLPLVHGSGPLTEANGFHDQGEVVIWARLAADLLGATKMDRPEDVEASPKTGKVYVTLTLNELRAKSGDKSTDPANPRPDNRFGHIIEITPDEGDHAAQGFRWEILLKCGDPSIAAVGATFNPATSRNGWFANPDNFAFDADGRLWVSTDGNTGNRTGRQDGLWALETEGPRRGTARCFFQVPQGAELCGPCFTPDGETLFVSVQHPGERNENDLSAMISTFDTPSTRWPDFKPGVPPRPSVVAITRKGGGRIGG